MKEILLYLWQLPQNLLGLALVAIYGAKRQFGVFRQRTNESVDVYVSARMRGCISLGEYIIVGKWYNHNDVLHEHGHQIQSRRLGWFYLPTVGLVSGLRKLLKLYKPGRYYDSWPENEADKLGGVTR